MAHFLSKIMQTRRHQKTINDRKARILKYYIGNRLWLSDPKPKRGKIPKLAAEKWSSTHTIARRISGVVYLIKYLELFKRRIENVILCILIYLHFFTNITIFFFLFHHFDNQGDESEYI